MPLDLSPLTSAAGALDRSLRVVGDEAQWTALSPAVQEAVSAGVIQNFEVAYEQSWKMIKRWLEGNAGPNDVDGSSRRHLFRMAAEAGLIEDVQGWMDFHLARNETSHTYNRDKARAVVEMAPVFLNACRGLLTVLAARND